MLTIVRVDASLGEISERLLYLKIIGVYIEKVV
jgi:hypothetical protein